MKFHHRIQRVQNLELQLLKSACKQFGILSYLIPQSPKDKSKSKVLPLHPMKAYRGSRGIAPLVLKLGARWRWVVNFTPRPLHDLERTPVHSEQEQDGSRVGLDVLQKRQFFPLTGFRTLDRPACSLVETEKQLNSVLPKNLNKLSVGVLGHIQSHGLLKEILK
jgi:hypothetical protein